MDADKMRAEFEAVARREGWSLRKSKGDPSEYWSEDTGVWWQWWQVAYAAGRKAAFSEWYAMEFEKWRKQGGERAAEWHAELERYKKEKQPEGER